MCKFSELKNKEVINVSTGERLGFVCDIEFDNETGKVNSIVLPPSNNKLFSFNKESETVTEKSYKNRLTDLPFSCTISEDKIGRIFQFVFDELLKDHQHCQPPSTDNP